MTETFRRVGPLSSLKGVRRELSRVYRSLHRGQITTKDSGARCYVLMAIGKLLETELLEERVAALESRASGAEQTIENTRRAMYGGSRGSVN